MSARLTIENGPAIELVGRPPQGTRHEVAFGVLSATGEPVVVKLERIPGTLERERAALSWLNGREDRVPRLIAAGPVVSGSRRRVALVTERRPGSAPTSLAGWRRMGRALARLADDPAPPASLPVLDPAMFGRAHARRVSDLGDRLRSLAQTTPDWTALVSPVVPGPAVPVITHGDPGPGNFLDDGERGTLIDWEQAHVAPRGLDLARLALIALLGAGPSGYVARDHRRRARAAVAGYLVALEGAWQPSGAEWRWWTAVAGVQLIHRRWELGGRPAPWEDAVDVLAAALAADRSVPLGPH